MATILYVIAIVLAVVAALGVANTKVNLLALAVAFFAAADLATHAVA